MVYSRRVITYLAIIAACVVGGERVHAKIPEELPIVTSFSSSSSGAAASLSIRPQYATGCINDCSGNGRCNVTDYRCMCAPGWKGSDCSVQECAEDAECSGHGVCADGKCWCDFLYAGAFCERRGCVNGCSGHGSCKNGLCKCNQGWKGMACSDLSCESEDDCSGHGTCKPRGEGDGAFCDCIDGWGGDDCMAPSCLGCSSNGVCDPKTLKCVCKKGWAGDDCAERACEGGCSGHGLCHEGSCSCFEGFMGPKCGKKMLCSKDCSAHGRCVGGFCQCVDGWVGRNCVYQADHSGEVGRAFQDLRSSTCPDSCTGDRGICVDGACRCKFGWGGKACDQKICPQAQVCDEPCCGRGICVEGQCVCKYGATGVSCENDPEPACPKNCNGREHGMCVNGKCHCRAPYVGTSCETVQCPFDCGGHGSCGDDGKCTCEDGWGGPSCRRNACPIGGTPPAECSSKGLCIEGSCLCPDESMSGPACENPDAPAPAPTKSATLWSRLFSS